MKPHPSKQRRTQSHTIGDAIGLAVWKGLAERQSTSKEKRSTRETDDERGRKSKGKETPRVETPELLKNKRTSAQKDPIAPERRDQN